MAVTDNNFLFYITARERELERGKGEGLVGSERGVRVWQNIYLFLTTESWILRIS